MTATPDCALFWESNMYIYQKSRPRSNSFSFLGLFDQIGFFSKNSNIPPAKTKLWRQACHVELHQMELYITYTSKNYDAKKIDKTIHLNHLTRVLLIERKHQTNHIGSLEVPVLSIKQLQPTNSQPTDKPNFIFQMDEESSKSTSSSSLNIMQSESFNSYPYIQTDLPFDPINERQRSSEDDYCFYCNNDDFDEENDVILTADDENTVIELLVAIKSAYFNNDTLSISDFHFLSVLGRGSFGKVSLVEYIKKNSCPFEPTTSNEGDQNPHLLNGNVFALKAIPKMKLIQTNSVQSALNERNILSRNRHPFIVSMKFAFQSATKFYIGLEFLSGGDLRHCMNKSFPLTTLTNDDNKVRLFISFRDIQMYLAEISLAMHHLHSNGVIYRDLKPENVMIADDGHAKLTDFGLSQEIGPNGTAVSTCGTLEYIAPEIISQSNYTFTVDWWSLGILAYELIFMHTPFSDSSKGRLFGKILNEEIKFPTINPRSDSSLENLNVNAFDELNNCGYCIGLTGEKVTYAQIKDFIKVLLTKDPKKRIRFDSRFKDHPFWGSLDFGDIKRKKFCPSFVPNCSPSVENFSHDYTNEQACDSIAAPPIGEKSIGVNGFSFFGSLVQSDEMPIDNQDLDDFSSEFRSMNESPLTSSADSTRIKPKKSEFRLVDCNQ